MIQLGQIISFKLLWSNRFQPDLGRNGGTNRSFEGHRADELGRNYSRPATRRLCGSKDGLSAANRDKALAFRLRIRLTQAIINGLPMAKTTVERSPQIRRPELKLAKRMSRLGTETAFEVLVRARALEAKGKDIIHLEIGEPDFDTPPNVVDAGVKALKGGWTHYGPSAGLPTLREAIAEEVSRSRDLPVSVDEVVV